MHEFGSILRVTDQPHIEDQLTPIPNYLVLSDDLGLSTSVVDGFSIAFAVAKHLVSIKNFVSIFVSHSAALPALNDLLPVVGTFHLLTKSRALN